MINCSLYYHSNIIVILDFSHLSFLQMVLSLLRLVECERDDDIYGHSYDDHDFGMSPGTGWCVAVIVLC